MKNGIQKWVILAVGVLSTGLLAWAPSALAIENDQTDCPAGNTSIQTEKNPETTFTVPTKTDGADKGTTDARKAD